MKTENYYVGLDIGTDSVGYAVTDREYNLLKFHGEPMWGVTLFDEASLSNERRSYRTARRRLDRKQQRVRLLQELFAKEIAKVDGGFFIRLQNSRLCREDTQDPGSVFPIDNGYSDKQYHKDYPTIHHLINELMQCDGPYDVRLVYLACAWLVAHRGHFLNDINAENVSELTDFPAVYASLLDSIRSGDDSTVIPWDDSRETAEKVGAVLSGTGTVSRKYGELCRILFNAPKAPKSADNFPLNPEVFLRLLCGYTVKAADLFMNEAYGEIESFGLDADDDKLGPILSQLDDDAGLIIGMKAVFDCALLTNSLSGKQSISEAKVERYEQHKRDLALLKSFLKKYAPEKYGEVLRDMRKDNYVAYSAHCKKSERDKLEKMINKADFCKYLKGVIDKITPDGADKPAYDEMKSRIEANTFLPKQTDSDNRVIPHQLYEYELTELLGRASAYLPFLTEKDKDGLTVSEKILSVFRFKVPYYVGPLNGHSPYAWAVRKPGAEGRILPWNFTDMIDEEASEQAFIDRLLGKCTYLPQENVLPKDSLLYKKFTVLNEINNLTVDSVPITVETKQGIYNDLFMKRRKVTVKAIRDYLIANGVMRKGQTLGGIDETVKSDLKPWLDFKRLMSSGTLTEEQVESIIAHRAYSEEKPRFVKWLRKEYANLPEEDLRYIAGLKYQDFGRLSKEFLNGLEGTLASGGTGEAFTVIGGLWETNLNLMELLSDKYTFAQTVSDIQREYYGAQSGSVNERLDSMYISNAVKRPVIRSLEIVKEIVKATGAEPDKIFIEMARGGKPEQKGKRTKSRKEQILELYDKVRDGDVRLLRQSLEDMGEAADSKLQGDRLFLYYMQLGKCLYSGEPMDITRLTDGTYNIEHIYPQAYVKDDSIINNEILVKSELNGGKSDTYPIAADIRHKMTGYWTYLKQAGLISEEKFKRLTRSTPFTDDEKMGFINRQLTETTQSTKAVATLLKENYRDSEIVYVKARLTSEFRQEFGLVKSRAFNDLHHAKDAYLNIVTGNVYDARFSKRWFNVHSEYSLKTKALFSRTLVRNGETVWDSDMLGRIKKTVSSNFARETVYALRKHHGQNGGFFDQNPLKKKDGLIPLKAGLPTEKYGGYSGSTTASFVLVRYPSGKKKEVMLFPVELLFVNDFFSNPGYAKSLVCEKLGIENRNAEKIEFPLGLREIKINALLSLDGFRVCLTAGSLKDGRLLLSPVVPFIESRETEEYLKKLEVFAEKITTAKKEKRTYVYDEKYDVVNAEKNLSLYDVYVQKLTTGVFARRPKAKDMKTILEKRRDEFGRLTVENQALTLLQIHAFFGRSGSGGVDLTAIKESKNSCKTRENLNLSNWKKSYADVRIIDASVTGLWEKISPNLLDLL